MGLLPSWFSVQVAFAPMPMPFFQALRAIDIETSIGQASIFRLHFELSRNSFGDFDALAIDIFRPMMPVKISIAAGLPIPQVLINGYIKDARLSAGDAPGTSRLEVVGMDALGTRMASNQEPFPWPNLSESEIAATIFGKYAILPLIDALPPTRTIMDTTTTQRIYDAAFLFELAYANNLDLFIQPDPITGRDVGHLHRPYTFVPHQGVLSIDFGIQSNLTQFTVANDMLSPTGVMGLMVDPVTRAPRPSFGLMSSELPMGMEPSLFRILPPPVEQQFGDGAANPTEAQLRAMARASATSRAIMAQGEVDGIKLARPLRVGLPVLVRGAGRQNSGLYYVDQVSHHISRDDYRQSFTAWRNAVGLTGAEVFVDPLAAVA
ncbi:hypothetical protein [Taklimakanibacter albus]|uniref:Uncharacterized protein n=1 Tax=Taklimakanibacter albus TaxID=2800327 RepID=A0ACC5RB26_9HYPH|nr:hypothetical protein [Aestuariivirga sp. YIM B02566]MBK1869691.1 hypothetical protein [Aestuariivirga sp. YIM B02566]